MKFNFLFFVSFATPLVCFNPWDFHAKTWSQISRLYQIIDLHILSIETSHSKPPNKNQRTDTQKIHWSVAPRTAYIYFHPYLGKWSNLTNIFQMGWHHQLDLYFPIFSKKKPRPSAQPQWFLILPGRFWVFGKSLQSSCRDWVPLNGPDDA